MRWGNIRVEMSGSGRDGDAVAILDAETTVQCPRPKEFLLWGKVGLRVLHIQRFAGHPGTDTITSSCG